MSFLFCLIKPYFDDFIAISCWVPNEINSIKKENPYSLSQLPKLDLEMPVTLKLPFSLESLLEIVADRDKNVVLGIAGASYRDMLMSWACRLCHLGVSNILVCALDSETYEFSALQV